MIGMGQKFACGEPTANVQLSCLTYRATALNGELLPLRQNGDCIRGGHRLRKSLAAKGECRRAATSGQEAEVSDFHEA